MMAATSRMQQAKTDLMQGDVCPSCGEDLDLQQPDPNRPERLLGVCLECGSWSIIEEDAGRSQVTMIVPPQGGAAVLPVRRRGMATLRVR